MRILSVADFYHHGSSRVVEDRAAALRRRGHEVVLLAGADPDLFGFERQAALAEGLEPELVPWFPADRGPRAILGLLRTFRGAFERLSSLGRFDALLLNQPLSAWAVLRSPASRGVPALYTFHSPWPVEWAVARGLPVRYGRLERAGIRERLEYAGRRWIEARALEGSSRITLLSDYMRSQLAEVHPRVPPQKVTLIPGGVDLDRFRPVDPGARRARKAALGFPPGAPLLLTVRRLVPRMGLETLLRSFRLLSGEFPDLRLAIGGAGPLEGLLRSLRGSLGLEERVRFLGFVSEGALPGLYAAADLFVLPTTQLEGFGLVTIEALACGTPVVGTPVGATPAILAGIDPRLLSRDSSPKGLAAAAAACLRLPPEELRAIAARGRRRVAALYGAETVGDSLEALLAGLAGAPRRPSPAKLPVSPQPRVRRARERTLSIR